MLHHRVVEALRLSGINGKTVGETTHAPQQRRIVRAAPLAGELLHGGGLFEQLLPEHTVHDRGREACPLAAPRLVLLRRSFSVFGDLGQGQSQG